jgi:hypothetical protein
MSGAILEALSNNRLSGVYLVLKKTAFNPFKFMVIQKIALKLIQPESMWKFQTSTSTGWRFVPCDNFPWSKDWAFIFHLLYTHASSLQFYATEHRVKHHQSMISLTVEKTVQYYSEHDSERTRWIAVDCVRGSVGAGNEPHRTRAFDEREDSNRGTADAERQNVSRHR